MNLNTFLESLKDELEIESLIKLNKDSDLTQIDEWDSMGFLILINFIKINFELNLETKELKNNLKIKDLINLIEKKSNFKIIE